MSLPSNSKELEFPFNALESNVDVSVVVPLLNERKTLAPITKAIQTALSDKNLEIIFVDDGSSDGSWTEICALAQRHSEQVRGFRHRRNFGKAEALSTGFANARGELVATIDADLQDDPSEIPALIRKLEEGFDLVSGHKSKRQDPISKTIPSRFFNFAARAVSGISLHDFNCGLKLYRREALTNLKLYGELHRFLPILVHAEGFTVTEIPVRHFPREHGESKYGWKRFFKGSLDLITITLLTRYLKRPGHFFGAIGLIAGTLGTGILGYLSFMKLAFGENIGARPLFFLGLLLFLFAGQMITTGIIGEFLLRQSSNHSTENKGRTVAATDHRHRA